MDSAPISEVLTCSNPDHNLELISGVCIREGCDKLPNVCPKCIENIHKDCSG